MFTHNGLKTAILSSKIKSIIQTPCKHLKKKQIDLTTNNLKSDNKLDTTRLPQYCHTNFRFKLL